MRNVREEKKTNIGRKEGRKEVMKEGGRKK